MKFLRVTFGEDLRVAFHDVSDIGSVVQIAPCHWRLYFNSNNTEPVDCFVSDQDIYEQMDKINSVRVIKNGD